MVIGRNGARRRTLEASTEVVPSLSHPERLDPEEGEAGTIAGWSGLAQVCRIHREVEYVGTMSAGPRRVSAGRRGRMP